MVLLQALQYRTSLMILPPSGLPPHLPQLSIYLLLHDYEVQCVHTGFADELGWCYWQAHQVLSVSLELAKDTGLLVECFFHLLDSPFHLLQEARYAERFIEFPCVHVAELELVAFDFTLTALHGDFPNIIR